jgi:integrase/recombinase XerD
MLFIFRRHQRGCVHRGKGRGYTRCQCPIWVDGRLRNIRVHRSMCTRDWSTAQRLVLSLESEHEPTKQSSQAEVATIQQGVNRFIVNLEGQKLRSSTVRKYRLLLVKQLIEFAALNGLSLLNQLRPETLDDFRNGWKDGALSSSKKLERLRAFFRFCLQRGWLKENPTSHLRAPKILCRPTLPYSNEEVMKIISATELYVSTSASNGLENAKRMRAFVLVLRYSGMRISDVVGLSVDRISGNRLFLYTQKTGVPVHTVLPAFVVSALGRLLLTSQRYFFWTGNGSLESAVRSWQTRLRKLFRLASLRGHAHRFRDTFAVELLMSGVPIERVSVLLGHQSVRVTERHYNPWVQARQQQLEADLERAWARDPMCLHEDEVTRRLRGTSEAVN